MHESLGWNLQWRRHTDRWIMRTCWLVSLVETVQLKRPCFRTRREKWWVSDRVEPAHVAFWLLHVHKQACSQTLGCCTAHTPKPKTIQSGWIHVAADYSSPVYPVIFFFFGSTARYHRVLFCTPEPTATSRSPRPFPSVPDFLTHSVLGLVSRHWSHVSNSTYNSLLDEMCVCWLSSLNSKNMTMESK